MHTVVTADVCTLFVIGTNLFQFMQEHVQYYIDETFEYVDGLYKAVDPSYRLTHLFCWFDNCAQDFKNQWNMAWCVEYAHRRNIICIIDFLAAQHGKRNNDGEGSVHVRLFLLSQVRLFPLSELCMCVVLLCLVILCLHQEQLSNAGFMTI